MRKDRNHRHRLKHGHLFRVLRTTLSLGSTTSLGLERAAIGSCHRRRCLDRGRRNLQRRRRNYRLQRLSRKRRYLRPPPLSRIRCPRLPPPQLSQTSCRPSFRPKRLSKMKPHRAARQKLCSEGQRSQTDEAMSRCDGGRRRSPNIMSWLSPRLLSGRTTVV